MVKRERIEPPSRTARRFAPRIETSLRASGARRQVPMRRYLFVKGENPPFHTFPRTRRQRTEFAAICFFRALGSTPPRKWSAGLRPASRGSAKPAPTTPRHSRQSHGCEPTHRRPRRITGTRTRQWSAGLRPASRGSAKPAPTTPRPPISRLRTHASPTAQNHGDMERMERRSPTGIARERETRTTNAAPRQSHAHEPTHRQPRRITPSMERWPVLPVGASDRHRAGARNPHRRRRASPLSALTRVPPPAA